MHFTYIQTSRVAGVCISLTNTQILGAMLMKMAVCSGKTHFAVGLLGAIFRKIAIFKWEKVVHMVVFSSLLGGDVEK